MDVRMPDGTIIRGVPDGTSRAELQRRLNAMGSAPQAAAKTPAAPAEPAPHPTDDMGWGEKALVNVGAGMDSAWQGAKQLVGQGAGDEALKEKRRIDAELADKTMGGGLLQMAGEIAPSIPLGMGAGAAAGRMLPMAMRGATALRGGVEAATSGALMPTVGDESRVTNMALAGAGGAVAPTLLKGALAASRGARNLADRPLAALPGDFLGSAARQGERLAGKAIRKAGVEDMPAVTYKAHPHIYGPASGAEVAGPSAAVATQSPALAALERGSRTSGGEHWMPFDQGTHRARWNALDTGLQTSDDMASKLAVANEIGAQVPYTAVGPKAFTREMDTFFEGLQSAKQTPQYHGVPAVKAAVDYVEKTMADAGQVTPELLHQMRRTLAKGLTGVPGAGEAGVRAAASEPFIIDIARSMDNVLENSSKGKWGNWKGDYADQMRRAEGAKADVNIRGRFIDEGTGMPRKPVAGLDDVPVLTPAALKQAVAAQTMKRGPQRGRSALSTPSQDIMEGVGRDLDAQAVIQRSKAASTGGSGSDTASNMMQSAIIGTASLPAAALRLATGAGNQKINQQMQRQLAALLQDPAKLRSFLQQQTLRRQPIDQQGLGLAMGSMPLMLANQ